jgi:arsenate reductase (thioredoxin)
VRAADVVVTLGCGGACPLTPATRYLDWPVPDPAGKPLAEVRRIRDELDLLITDLLDTLEEDT